MSDASRLTPKPRTQQRVLQGHSVAFSESGRGTSLKRMRQPELVVESHSYRWGNVGKHTRMERETESARSLKRGKTHPDGNLPF